jgi:hypothetical protein
MSNRLIEELREELSEIHQEMKACMAEMASGIDYDYNEDLLDELYVRRDAIRLKLETTESFAKFARRA